MKTTYSIFLQKVIDNKKLNELLNLIFLCSLTWGSRFYYSSQFGIYEDDQYRVPIGMTWTSTEFFDYLAKVPFKQLRMDDQGRVLHGTFIQTFSYLGNQLNHLHGIYIIGYCIVTLNTILFYFLLKRLNPYPFFALIGGIAFALFSADTTQAFLTHALGVQPSLSLVLIGFHLYISSLKELQVAAYLPTFLSLFCYEKFFLVFLAAPLLKLPWTQKTKWNGLRHTSVLVSMLAVVAFLRRLSGERRVSQLGATEIFKMFTDMIVGPLIGMSTYLYRPVTGLLSLQLNYLFPLSLFFLGLFFILYISSLQVKLEAERVTSWKQVLQPLYHWIVIGVVMLALAYPLTWVGKLTTIAGRGSRVHAAAVIGGSIVCACLLSAAMLLSLSRRKSLLASFILATFFSLLLAFGFTIQADFIRGWQYQRAFWTDLIELAPDITKGTVILVPQHVTYDNSLTYIRSDSYWNQVFSYLYQFPKEWIPYRVPLIYKKHPITQVPFIFELKRDWKNHIEIVSANSSQLRFNQDTIFWSRLATEEPEIESSRIIMLEIRNRKLVRRTEPIYVNGQAFPLKQNDVTQAHPSLEPGILFPYLIKDPSEPSISYVRDAYESD